MADQLGAPYLAGDNYFWVKPEPPFLARRSREERLKLLSQDIDIARNFVLAGDIDGWGAELENSFDLIVFLYLETQVRIDRLRAREVQRFGSADAEFLVWAAQYDVGTALGRTLANQRAWLSTKTCPIITIEGDVTVEERLRVVLDRVDDLEDIQDAEKRLIDYREGRSQSHSLDEIVRSLGLAD